MNIKDYNELINCLRKHKDYKYLEFNKKIVNSKSLMIGIRTPIIKELAKNIFKNNPYEVLSIIKNKYYEETVLEGFIISKIKDSNLFDKYLESFVLKIDNWAACDMCISNMKQLRKDEKYFELSQEYIHKDKEFVARCGYIIMLCHFLDEKHIDKILDILNTEKESNYYYVNMAKAWLISICYIKFKDKTLKFIFDNNLDPFTYNKAIQKIIESNRVDKNDKDYLRTLKRKA